MTTKSTIERVIQMIHLDLAEAEARELNAKAAGDIVAWSHALGDVARLKSELEVCREDLDAAKV